MENSAGWAQRPLYVVLFDSEKDDSDQPVRSEPFGEDEPGTVPHHLDRAVAAALPALWYCLHLPNDLTQMLDLPANAITALQRLDLSHDILLMPTKFFTEKLIRNLATTAHPMLVICPDDRLDHVAPISKSLGFALAAIGFSRLSDESLHEHWRQIHRHHLPEQPYLGREPSLPGRLDLAPAALPMRWLARQYIDRPWAEIGREFDIDPLVKDAIRLLLGNATTNALDQAGATQEEGIARWDETFSEQLKRFSPVVTVSMPGVPASYSRMALTPATRSRVRRIPSLDPEDTWSLEIGTRPDSLTERAAIELVVTRRAIGRGGIGIPLPEVPQEAFTQLAELERHFEGTVNGTKVWRMLERLNQAANVSWTPGVLTAISRASMIYAYTNFPIGLLRLPSDSAPLMTRVPIAYRPVLPLTRTLQLELSRSPGITLRNRCKVLVAECIPTSDPVGVASRQGWDVSEQYFAGQAPAVELQRTEALSIAELQTAIKTHKPDILVISAHGSLSRETNTAALVIGKDLCLGPELDEVPPVVILSACYTAPRGRAIVGVADLLLRQGALAVLGTQVPVDVRHNAALMVRFFVYIGEVLAGRESHSNLLEVWHRTQASNAINDVLLASRSLHAWGRSRTESGSSVLAEFMERRSVGRLRRGHIYSDTEMVLCDMADSMGVGSQVRNWLKRPGYVPESFFYVFVGRPDSIYFDDPFSAAGFG
ncbi:CHAT domain-containing protein [Micromonospora sp. CA-263727]|uniref:CHAT domain-containing protein n=1 Tax=Micromonospora sp. CA-263727 TaxID=3239967 RepID=UPI003D9168F6